jgi:DNA segregation ATPase FtsK/SpoIIIE, S-DNA-T family
VDCAARPPRAVGAATWWFLPQALVLIPRPPAWAAWAVLALVVLTLGWIGRPQGRALVARPDPRDAGLLEKPTAPMVVDALVRLAIPRLTEKTRDDIRVFARFLRDLPREENPLSKVTSELVDRYPHLAPIVLLVDEVQVYSEYEDPKVREEFVALFTDLVKRGRSAGIIPVFCTQKPDAKALPSSIASNCSVRLCFRVNDWKPNDQVLGTGMHSTGVKAALFSAQDKGLAWLKGDGGDPQVVRTVFGLDAVAAEELMMTARAIREGRGLLTGQAAGEEAEREELQVSLLDDARHAFQQNRAMLLGEIREGLELLRPGIWGHLDNDALGALLKEAGVRLGTVYSTALKREGYGVKREWLGVAATADEDPDDGDGEVIDLSERRRT